MPVQERHSSPRALAADAAELRRRILSAFEAAEVSSSEEDRRTALTFTVVGAGPTGVEMAAQ